ncbi:MAG: ABC transporter ATP-binding protein [Alphaproteobacteria bacterium]|nr:MAG: ABC transporter ATP-binding protein [Alphaproteobacteria bacterium]
MPSPRALPLPPTSFDGKMRDPMDNASARDDRRAPLLRRCVKIFRRQRRLFAGVALCMLVLGLLQLPGPILTMRVIDSVTSRGAPLSIGGISLMCAALLGALLSVRLISILQRFTLEKFKYRIIFSMQRALFSHALKLPAAHYLRQSHGYMMSRVNEDPYRLQGILADTIVSILGDVITLAIGVGFLFYVHWRMALVSVIVLPLLVVLFTRLRTSLKADFRRVQEQSAKVSRFLGESLSNVLTIKLLTLEALSRRQLAGNLSELIRQRFHILRRRMTYENLIAVLTGVVPIAILWYGAIEIVNGRLSVGAFIAFNGFLAYLYRPAEGIVIALLSMQGSIAAVERIFEILDTPPERYGPRAGGRPRWANGGTSPAIAFCEVSFRYPGKKAWVLRDVCFEAARGEMLAVSGPSGVGKTTLLSLIPRLVEQQRGMVLIDGVDHRQIHLLSLRRRVAVVSQETRLFSGSILENLRRADRQVTVESAREALRIAAADEFVDELPEGLATELGETGLNLSAGQRQRLLIARAILRDPAILILDEATASLDAELEATVLANLRAWQGQRTVIAVSHRPAIHEFAHRSLELRDGKVVPRVALDPRCQLEESPRSLLSSPRILPIVN